MSARTGDVEFTVSGRKPFDPSSSLATRRTKANWRSSSSLLGAVYSHPLSPRFLLVGPIRNRRLGMHRDAEGKQRARETNASSFSIFLSFDLDPCCEKASI